MAVATDYCNNLVSILLCRLRLFVQGAVPKLTRDPAVDCVLAQKPVRGGEINGASVIINLGGWIVRQQLGCIGELDYLWQEVINSPCSGNLFPIYI